MKLGTIKYLSISLPLFSLIIALSLPACVQTGKNAIETHSDNMKGIAGSEYHIPKRPIDRHFIGAAWSKQFGPIEDKTREIRTKKEKSFNDMQQDFAYKTALGLGAQTVVGPVGEIGAEGSSVDKTRVKGVEIISPVSIADIPFKVGIPYVTEALRVEGFKLRSEKENQAGVNVSAGTVLGSGSVVAEAGSKSRAGTSGEGLVVAYKLQAIDKKTLEVEKDVKRPLKLDEPTAFEEQNLIINARLNIIEPGSAKSLPGDILWACPRAAAKRRDMIAAWVVTLKFTDRRRKSLRIAFPGYPEIADCDIFSDVVFSRIDPATDRIHRERVSIILNKTKLSDDLTPVTFDATVSHEKESFKIKLVRAGGG